MAYPNGQIPSSALSGLSSDPGQQLLGAAARQWDALAYSVRNRYGWLPQLTDSYRPYSVQERIFLQRYDHQYRSGLTLRNGGIKHWRDRTWYKKPGFAVAATPGTSNHGKGEAVDVTGLGWFGSTKYNQLASLAGQFGFSNANGRQINEPWHWEYTGSYTVDNPIGGGSGGTIDVPGVTPPGGIDEKDWFDMATKDDLRAVLNEYGLPTKPEKTELLDAAREIKPGGTTYKYLREIPKRTADMLPSLTPEEQREVLDAARYIKKNGEGDRFMKEIPTRTVNLLKGVLATPDETA